MAIVWISEPPQFIIDGEAVKVTLLSDDEPIVIRLSRHHCRLAAARVNKLLDEADARERGRVRKLRAPP